MLRNRFGGYRTHLGVPLKREGQLIGIIVIGRVTVPNCRSNELLFRQSRLSQAFNPAVGIVRPEKDLPPLLDIGDA
jgi:hypothetical protein